MPRRRRLPRAVLAASEHRRVHERSVGPLTRDALASRGQRCSRSTRRPREESARGCAQEGIARRPKADRFASNRPIGHFREAETERCYRSTGLFNSWAPEPGIAGCFSGDDPSVRDMCRYRRVVDFHRARSARSSRTRPGLNGQPPSPTAGWALLYRVDAPWAGSPSTLRARCPPRPIEAPMFVKWLLPVFRAGQ